MLLCAVAYCLYCLCCLCCYQRSNHSRVSKAGGKIVSFNTVVGDLVIDPFQQGLPVQFLPELSDVFKQGSIVGCFDHCLSGLYIYGVQSITIRNSFRNTTLFKNVYRHLFYSTLLSLSLFFSAVYQSSRYTMLRCCSS